MAELLRIFVPEYVPLDNKGEEAIIRGYGDALFPDREVQFTVLDNVDRPLVRDGIHVWPRDWFYSNWRTRPFTRSVAPVDMLNSACSLIRHLTEFFPLWAKLASVPVRRCRRFFKKVERDPGYSPANERERALLKLIDYDYIVAGHDGVLRNIDECHVLRLLTDIGFAYGIFGIALPIPLPTTPVHQLFSETFAAAEYFYTRNPPAIPWAQEKFPDVRIEAAPDPAFAMTPASEDAIDDLIKREGLRDFFEKPVIMMSVCETEATSRYGFVAHKSAQSKEKAHTELIGALVQHLIELTDANILFLPHCIGPSKRLDDRMVSRKVLEQVSCAKNRVGLLETEYDARTLKGLIARAEMIVSERIHALIGAVDVATPLVCLGTRADVRCTSIIGHICESLEQIYYLESPDIESLKAHVTSSWHQRQALKKYLVKVGARISQEIKEVDNYCRGHMSSAGRRKITTVNDT